MDTRIKNTPEELESYEPAVDSLLDKVMDEYGFIVSGWSAEWDAALRNAFDRSSSKRYPCSGPAETLSVNMRRA